MVKSSLWLIHFVSQRLSNSDMKSVDEIRRENLCILRDYYGGVRALADYLGKSESQVSQWLNASAHSETGKPRGMRPSSAREIEEKTGKPKGWLDHSSEPAAKESVSTLYAKEPEATYKVASIKAHQKDKALTELCAIYETMSEQGRWELVGQARMLAKIHPKIKANHVS